MLPEVNDQYFGRCKRKQRGFALKVLWAASSLARTRELSLEKAYLVLPALAPVGAFNIHNHDIHVLSPAHPYTCTLNSYHNEP